METLMLESVKSVSAPKDKYFDLNVFEAKGYRDHYANLTAMMKKNLRLERLRGRKVIDLACGYGWWGQSLLEYGCEVVFLDGREENLAAVREQVPNAATYLMNVETDPFPVPRADLILCMGLIYHIADPRSLFDKMAAVSDQVFVETTCLDHDGEFIVYHNESTDARQFSLTGSACRPSPKWVMRQLREAGFAHVEDVSDAIGNRSPQPGFPGLVYDWKFERTCGWRRGEQTLRRMFVASKAKHGADLIIHDGASEPSLVPAS
jgi:SAM-dependent methyltransferase